MTYNVFGRTLSLTQSITSKKHLTVNQDCYDRRVSSPAW